MSTYIYTHTIYTRYFIDTEVLYRDLKHPIVAACFRSDKVRTASVLDVF